MFRLLNAALLTVAMLMPAQAVSQNCASCYTTYSNSQTYSVQSTPRATRYTSRPTYRVRSTPRVRTYKAYQKSQSYGSSGGTMSYGSNGGVSSYGSNGGVSRYQTAPSKKVIDKAPKTYDLSGDVQETSLAGLSAPETVQSLAGLMAPHQEIHSIANNTLIASL